MSAVALVNGLGCGSSSDRPPTSDTTPDGGSDDASTHDASSDDAQVADVATDASRFERARATQDLPDDEPGAYQVHVLYVEPKGRTSSPALDTSGSIRRSLEATNAWLALQTGGRSLRFDRAGGAIDITFVKLSLDENEVAEGGDGGAADPLAARTRLEQALASSLTDAKKLYLAFYDGLYLGSCGNSPRPGHLPIVYVGGVWSSTFLTSQAAASATSLSVYDTTQLPLPVTPFDAKLGAETVTVTSIAGNVATLAAPLGAQHATGELLLPSSRPQDCRLNARSSTGSDLHYEDFAAMHELFHALGIVADGAPDIAPPPVAGGHLSASSPAGTADLMYQGAAPWGCSVDSTSAQTSPCKVDPSHRNYLDLPDASPLVDLGKSVFVTPTAADARLPEGW